jgi:hypothetical protein
MALSIDISPWRTPLLRRLAGWLALAAVSVHTLVMAIHGPAIGAMDPASHLAAPCHGDIQVHDAPAEPNPEKDHGYQPMVCPICQSLQGHGYLPQSIAVVWAPLMGSAEPLVDLTESPPPRLAPVGISARGPPNFV